MNEETIVDNFITFFGAGMDTTAHLANILIYLFTQYPDYFEKVKAELKTHYYDKAEPEVEDLKKMDFFDCFIKEALRHYTPVPGTGMRIATEDHMLGDIKIKKGHGVLINAFFNWFNPKYIDEPEKFYPERW
mmetsp:Transcript_18029/g.15749  ORF Transcript_18029/g.15749 Transcript_18029/m.15749 type:complete len:132 (+) Transcript_18029:901-1296(+)